MGVTSSKRKKGPNPYPLAIGSQAAAAASMPPGFQPQGLPMQPPHFLAGNQNPYHNAQLTYPSASTTNPIFSSMYQPGYRRKRNRQKRDGQGTTQTILPFIPPGFQPQHMPTHIPMPMPQPQQHLTAAGVGVGAAGAPPPLFTPGNGTGTQLRGFPSPFVDGGGGGGGGGHATDTNGTNRRPQTPFLPPLDGRYEAQDDSHRQRNNSRRASRHRRNRTEPADLHRSVSRGEDALPSYPRLEIVEPAIQNPLPEPPRNVYEVDYKQVLDLPGTKTLLTTNYENLRGSLPALLQAIASRPVDQAITTLPLRQATPLAPVQAQAHPQSQSQSQAQAQARPAPEKKGGLFHKLSVRRNKQQEQQPPAPPRLSGAAAHAPTTPVPIPTSSQNPPIIFYPLVLPNPTPPPAVPHSRNGGSHNGSRSGSHSGSQSGHGHGHGHGGGSTSRHRASSDSHHMPAPPPPTHIPTPPPFTTPVIPEGIMPMHDDELSPLDSGDDDDDDHDDERRRRRRRSYSITRSGSYRSSAESEEGGSGSTHPTSYHPEPQQQQQQQQYPQQHPQQQQQQQRTGTLPAIYFQQSGEHSGFLNHSPHRVLYQNKTYPSAAHLWEAMKYLDRRPDLAERIRMCGDVVELFQLTSSESFRKEERADWAKVFLKVLEDVVYYKFKQHRTLRALLMSTGNAPLVYSDPKDPYWGDGPLGTGLNNLGKVLHVVRERLRREGE